MTKKAAKNSEGFSLVEILIYVAILGLLIATVTSFFTDVLKSYNKDQAKSDVASSVSSVLKSISDEISYAKGIYAPTSVFDSNAGQLSIETALNTPSDHSLTFVDFYIDNGVIYEKREGISDVALTSEKVFITKLRFEKLTSSGKDTIKITIQGNTNTLSNNPEYQADLNLTSTASFRGDY